MCFPFILVIVIFYLPLYSQLVPAWASATQGPSISTVQPEPNESFSTYKARVIGTAKQDAEYTSQIFFHMSKDRVKELLKENKPVFWSPHHEDLLSFLQQAILEEFLYNNVNTFHNLYIRLWSLSQIQGVEKIEERYKDIIRLLKDGNKMIDPDLAQIPLAGTDISSKVLTSEIINPLKDEQEIIIFGSGKSYHKNQPQFFTVDISKDPQPDMIADMNNASHLSVLPERRFTAVYVEHIPGYIYLNKYFLSNAHRLLKEGGTLIINDMEYTKEEPYNLDYTTFLQKHGFKDIRFGPCSFNMTTGSYGFSLDNCVFATKGL